jgi:ATP-dependent DNA helicase RecQ
MTLNPTDILKEVYGYDSFRGQQEEIINHVMSRKNAFVLMPTGSGKSLCYQVPSICMEGVGIIVSPLVALMQDQVEALSQLGVKAAAINSNMDSYAVAQAQQALQNNELDLLYVAPERLLMEGFLQSLKTVKIALFAIDEAHCVSQWGHDFRPHYTQLSILNELFPEVPRIALTATADVPTRKDIVERLHLDQGEVFMGGFDRPNIHYSILPKNRPKEQLLHFIKTEHPDVCGIVYCGTRKLVDETVIWLRGKGIKALPYHAGLPREERTENQKAFLYEESVVMVATIAFGMGIDKPDVRFVVHLSTPKNIEAYYQETGRAGRDGLPADALMLFGISDVARQRSLIDDSNAPEEQKRIEHQKLSSLLTLCEAACCRRQVLLTYFGDESEPCKNCDNCDNPPEMFDGTVPAQKAMSCVYRTEQRFGLAYLIDVLLGKDDDRITRFRHDRISTFGIGKDMDKFQWQNVFRQLISLNLLMVDIAAHGGIKLTAKGRQVLKDRSTIMMRLDEKPHKVPKVAASKDPISFANDSDQHLFQLMREKRLQMAQSMQLPPYIILSDRSLHELASKRPSSKDELHEIKGFGAVKIQKYGEIFLEIIAADSSDERMAS